MLFFSCFATDHSCIYIESHSVTKVMHPSINHWYMCLLMISGGQISHMSLLSDWPRASESHDAIAGIPTMHYMGVS